MGMWKVLGGLILMWGAILVCASILEKAALAGKLRRTHKSLSKELSPRSYLSLWPDSWVAVKSRSAVAVQVALSLHNPKPCSWLEGFTNVDMLFVAPPVKGWILVTGRGLPDPGQDIDACFRFVSGLSRKLGKVQFFTANRATGHHAWIKAHDGRIVRAYAWANTTVWQQGPPTREEVALHLACFDYAESPKTGIIPPSRVFAANVSKVPLLAARWGLDLTSVRAHFLLDEHGVTGKAAYHY